MSSLPQTRLTPEEYLAFERQSDYKSEYVGGEVFAMTGASRRHNLIATNITRELSQQLKDGPCEVYTSDMRVFIPSPLSCVYPDVSVACGDPRFADDYFDSLMNPTLVVEILSPSSERYDRGRKFEHYRTLPSLLEYLLVSQEKVLVERYVRQPARDWLLTEFGDRRDRIKLASINCELQVQEIYRKVQFD